MADEAETALVKTKGESDQPALPGQANEDKKLIDAAVKEVNRLYLVSQVKSAFEIGEYLVVTFFGGDAERSKSEDSVSFRALAKRKEDLAVSHSWLWAAARVYANRDQIPEDIRHQLSFSHHRALLPLSDDPKATASLAKKAVKEGLTKVQLDELVAEHRATGDGDPRGRPPEPTFITSLKRLNKAAEVAKWERDFQSMLSRFSEDGLASLKKKAQTEYRKAQSSLAKLTKYLDEVKTKIDAM